MALASGGAGVRTEDTRLLPRASSPLRRALKHPADSSEAPLAQGLHQPVPTSRERSRQAAQHPLVRQAMELFDAEVLHVIQPAAADAEGEDIGSAGSPG